MECASFLRIGTSFPYVSLWVHTRSVLCVERTYEHQGEKGGCGEPGDWHIHTIDEESGKKIVKALAVQLHLIATPWSVARQAPLSMGFSRQEYWNVLPYLPPGNVPNPVIKPVSLRSPTLKVGSLLLAQTGKRTHTRTPFLTSSLSIHLLTDI